MYLSNYFVIICAILLHHNSVLCHIQKPTLTSSQHTQHDPHQPSSSAPAAVAAAAAPSYQRNNNVSRWNRQFTTSTPHINCDYKEVMNKIYDRVGVFASLDNDLRNRLDNVDKKIVQFETSNLARLDSLNAQQMDVVKRLDNMEFIERMTNKNIEELKGDFEALYKNRTLLQQTQKQITDYLENDLNLSRIARQADDESDSNKKLDALATFLVSTREAITDLQAQLQANITKLALTTSNLQKRFNNLQRRQQVGGGGVAYLPPPPNYYATTNLPQQLITSCAQGATTVNGILKLQLTATSEPFYVSCDERSMNGGWTVILNRYNGDVNFQRDWLEYKAGFGNLAGEFFIGLEKLHALTSSAVHELVILLQDFEGDTRYAKYSLFAIGNEEESYALKLLGKYEGTAGDALTYHAGSKFSTFDNDNDGCLDCNCAQAHMGAWWYNWCEMSNLNGKYFETDYDKAPAYQGMYWHHFHGPSYSLKAVKMMIRPVDVEGETTH